MNREYCKSRILKSVQIQLNSRLLWLPIVVGLLSAAANECEAQQHYGFTEISTGHALAKLELSALPATHTEIIRLSFTQAGQTRFGYGPEYLGSFDSTINPILDDGNGNLVQGLVHDDDPVNSSLQSLGTFRVALEFGFNPNVSAIILTANEPRQVPSIVVTGNWRSIPEPITLLFGVPLLLAISSLRLSRLRGRNFNSLVLTY